jgi:hypothetical protein
VIPHDPYDEMGPDSTRDLSDLEPVEVAPDYHVELGVPFTSEQLREVSRIAREQGVSPGKVAQDLIEQALAARRRP